MTERDESDAGWAMPDQPPLDPTGAPAGPLGATPPPPPPPGVPAPPPSAAWQTAPPPGGFAPTGAHPTPRRRRAWLVVLISVMSAIVLVGLAGTVLFVDRTLPPYNGAHDFLSDIVHGRETSAITRLCADDQSDPTTAFELVTQNFVDGATVSVNALGVDRSGDEATVEYTVSRSGSASHTYKLPVRLEDGNWQACPS